MREFDYNGLLLCKYQGELFEKSLKVLDCSTPIFIRRFLHSDLLRTLDNNDSARLTLNVIDGFHILEDQYGKSQYGKKKFSSESMFWMGYLYRYISYTRDISTRLLFKLFDYKKVNELYYTYHTQNMEWCVENLLELFNYNENIFDKNWRLKEAIKKYYYTNNIKF